SSIRHAHHFGITPQGDPRTIDPKSDGWPAAKYLRENPTHIQAPTLHVRERIFLECQTDFLNALKKRALEMHPSQASAHDYQNSFRSLMFERALIRSTAFLSAAAEIPIQVPGSAAAIKVAPIWNHRR